jgi:hypothetical protein
MYNKHHVFEQIGLRSKNFEVEGVPKPIFLLHHKRIEFSPVLFHNVVIVERYLSGCNPRREKGGFWYYVGLGSKSRRGEPLNFPVHKTQGSLLTGCNIRY